VASDEYLLSLLDIPAHPRLLRSMKHVLASNTDKYLALVTARDLILDHQIFRAYKDALFHKPSQMYYNISDPVMKLTHNTFVDGWKNITELTQQTVREIKYRRCEGPPYMVVLWR